MRLLLVYPPFCTPAAPPYSMTYLSAFLRANCEFSVDVMDLNAFFHNSRFGNYGDYYRSLNDLSDYDEMTRKYDRESRQAYSKNNGLVVKGKNPELFDESVEKIRKYNPDAVAFSVVYSSQVFYAYSLAKELRKDGIKVIVGGPAVNGKLAGVSDAHLKNEFELLEYLTGTKIKHDNLNLDLILDYDVFDLNDYFVKDPVLPIKTSMGCYHARCAFCTHHMGKTYFEYPLSCAEKTVANSDRKYFFIVDDMIPKKRLLDIARIMKRHGKRWTCQLKPTKEYDEKTLLELKESGLIMVMWGIESGCDRILTLMDKGTNAKDISKVLHDSSKAGIKNIAYIIFGFPTETRQEFLETIRFLEENEDYIDLVSTSIFGLQKESIAYADPGRYGITRIIEEKRTILGPKISYEVREGLTNEEASKLRDGYKKTIEKINKFPKLMNYFREHMLISIS